MTIPFSNRAEPTNRLNCQVCGNACPDDLITERVNGHGFRWVCRDRDQCDDRRSRFMHPTNQVFTGIRNAVALDIVLVLAIVVLAVAMINAVGS